MYETFYSKKYGEHACYNSDTRNRSELNRDLKKDCKSFDDMCDRFKRSRKMER